MKVVVIGGTGMVGKGVVEAAVHAGHNVVVVHRGKTIASLPDGVRVVHADRNAPNAALIEALNGCDALIDLACYSGADAAALVALLTREIRLIMISSVLVHGGKGTRPISETSDISLLSKYADGKFAAELVLRDAHSLGSAQVTIVRLGACYREGLHLDGQLFEDGYWIHEIQQGLSLVVADAGRALWSVLHSNDAGNAIVRLLSTPAANGDTFLVASDKPLSWSSYYSIAADAAGLQLSLVDVPLSALLDHMGPSSFPAEMSAWDQTYDLTHLRNAIGNWQEERDQHTGLFDAMRLLLENEQGSPDESVAMSAWLRERYCKRHATEGT